MIIMVEKVEKTQEQIDCIEFEGKPLIIQAGPGAGKTFVLVERIKYLLNVKKVDPESLLVITFTRKAADQLKTKLSNEKDVGISKVNKMFINTIHAFCISFLSENGYSDINLLESTENNERKAMFLRKHKKDLGFTREAYISGGGLKDVISKFEEYTTFGVDTDKLVEYIEETRPVSDEYKELIASCGEGDDFEYPYYEVSQSKELKQSQYTARYLAVAKAYPEYIKLLEQENSFDFNYLQLKVKEILKNKDIARNSRFKNIFIDEYQDIDPIQNDIFNSLLEYCDTFTVVGDDDQSIYSFRGSVPKYFVDFSDDNEDNVLKLTKNFRSCQKIVEYNEDYIEPIREFEKELVPNKKKKGGVYYLINSDEDTQAERIANILLHLREEGKIKQYSDVGLLLSSVNYAVGVKNLIGALQSKGIPYNLSENDSLMSNEEVKAMIILLWYMKESGGKIILSDWEKDWLNNSAFSEVKDILKLDSTTCDILSSIETAYQNEMLETEKEVWKEFSGKSSRLSKFSGIFNRPPEVVDEVLKRVERFDISTKTREDLISLGITNEHDLDLFENLYNLKQKLYDENTEFYDRPSILNVYYEILQYTGILEDRLENPTEENQRILRNLGIITETISNYEEIVTKYSINGLLWFIFQEFDNYATQSIPSDSIDKVQIMTVHKSKGLEFPVVILASIKDGKFPKHKDLDAEVKDYASGTATYPTPLKYLNYKYDVFKLTDEEKESEEEITPEMKEIMEENRESKRVYYVGSTRAEDVLILSSLVDEDGNTPDKEIQEIEDNPSYIELTDDYKPIVPAECDEKEPEEEKLKISYTHFSEYNNCGQEYNLRYNYMFKNSKNKSITFGQVAHTILNLIHQKQIGYQKNGEDQLTSKEEVQEIINRVKEFNHNIDDEVGEFNEIEEAIYKYWENYTPYWNYDGKCWEVLASEVPFTLIENDYDLEGKIDLIIKDKDSNDIILIDFKTTAETSQTKLKERYQKQLITYAMAIKQTPEYEKYNIKEAMIYSVKYSQPIPVPINDMDIDELTDSLNNTVEKILDGHFQKCKDTSKCFNCEYNKSICRRV